MLSSADSTIPNVTYVLPTEKQIILLKFKGVAKLLCSVYSSTKECGWLLSSIDSSAGNFTLLMSSVDSSVENWTLLLSSVDSSTGNCIWLLYQ